MSNVIELGEYVQCNHCRGTGSLYVGFNSYLDEENYVDCHECGGLGGIYLDVKDGPDGY